MWRKIQILQLFSCPAVNITMLTVLLYGLFVLQAEFCMFLFVCVLMSLLSFRKPSYVSLFVCPALLFIYRCLLSSCPDCPSYRLSCVSFLAVLLHFQELTAIFSLLSFLLTVLYFLFGCPAFLLIFPSLLFFCPCYPSYRPCPVCPFLAVSFFSWLSSRKPSFMSFFCLSCFAIHIWVLAVLLSWLTFLWAVLYVSFWLSCFISKNLLPSSPYCPSYWLSCISFLAVLLFC